MAVKAHQSHANKIEQACAAPFRFRARTIEVCLITSSTGRWIFSKGVAHPDESLAAHRNPVAGTQNGYNRTRRVGPYRSRKSHGLTRP